MQSRRNPDAIQTQSRRNQDAIQTQSRRNPDAIKGIMGRHVLGPSLELRIEPLARAVESALERLLRARYLWGKRGSRALVSTHMLGALRGIVAPR
jgi:hypothetical protein